MTAQQIFKKEKKKRKEYEVGDHVLFTQRKKRSIITYITIIEQKIINRPGYKPYRLIGFNNTVGRKELNSPTKEHILRYKLFNFHGAVPVSYL